MTALTHNSFNLQHPRDCRIGSGALIGRIRAFLAMQKCSSSLVRDMQALRGLSDHHLRDIGLSRSDVGGWYDRLKSNDQKIRILSGR